LDKEKNISKRDVPLWTKSKYPKQKHPPLDIIFLLDISLLSQFPKLLGK
jgi:hypothetical protein